MNAILARVGPPIRAIRGVVGNPSLRRAEIAFTFFNTAEIATWIAILVYAHDRGGASEVGVVGMLLILPASVIAPIAGTFGDRIRRERVVRLGYAAQAATAAATGIAMATRAPAAIVYALAALGIAAITTGRPGHHSVLPDIAETPDELTAANSVSSLAEGLGGTVGATAAGVLLGAAGVAPVYLASSVALAVAAALAFGIRSRHAPIGRAMTVGNLVSEALAGFSVTFRSPPARALVGLAAVVTVVWGAFDILLVTLAVDVLGIGQGGVGFLHTAATVGGLVGAAGSIALVGRRTLVPAIVGGCIALGGAIALTGTTEVVPVAVVAVIAAGATGAVLDVAGRVLLQRVVDEAVLTRVFGVIETLWMFGFGLGSALSALLVRWLGIRSAFVLAGAALPIAAVVGLRALRRADREAKVPERQSQLLLGIPMFAALPRLDLERAATQLTAIEVRAGEAIVVEGDVGDRFYVIDRGTFQVSAGETMLGALGEGDHFGEIALLHDVPRTATVRATEDGMLWALDREDFLGTVTGIPQAADAAAEVSAERLRARAATTSGTGGAAGER